MVKKLASKVDRRLLTDIEIRDKGLNKSEFTPTWQGKLYILNVKNSKIAEKATITSEGEYAIKTR